MVPGLLLRWLNEPPVRAVFREAIGTKAMLPASEAEKHVSNKLRALAITDCWSGQRRCGTSPRPWPGRNDRDT